MAVRDGDLLVAVDGPGDGSGGGLAAERATPEELSVGGIEGEEVAFAAAGEEEIGCGGEEAELLDREAEPR